MPALATLGSCGRQPYSTAEFRVADHSSVGILAAASYDADLTDVIWRGLKLLRPDVSRRRVLLKPNLVEYEPGNAAISTHPMVVAAAAECFMRLGARQVVVAEGPGHRRDIDYLVRASGLGDALAQVNVPFADLNHDDVEMVSLRTAFMGISELALPAEVLSSDFVVSVPKLKIHHWAGMTCSMKNLFGVVPGAVYGWPKNFLHYRGISNAILDLVSTVRPSFTIVDAVVCMEGNGPITGKPRHLGVLAMGADLVAVDATCARLIGLDPARIGYLATAGRFLGNAGEERIAQRGEPLSRFRSRFDLIPRLEPLRLEG